MNKLKTAIVMLLLILPASLSLAQKYLDPPEFAMKDFLLIPDIERFTLDFALAWTDSLDWARPGHQY